MYTTTDFFKALYFHEKANAKGLVCISTKLEDRMIDKFIPIHKFNDLEQFTGDLAINKYFTVNNINSIKIETDSESKATFKRREQDVNSLNALALDLDVIKQGLTIDYALSEIEKLETKPNIIVNTGNGLQLYYLIETIPVFKNSAKTRKRYKQTLDLMIQKLKYLGSDSAVKSTSQLMRLPKTMNVKPKNGNYGGIHKVEILDINTEHIYTLKELSMIFDKNYKEYIENGKPKKNKVIPFKEKKESKGNNNLDINNFDLRNDRINDLKKLIGIRNGVVKSRNDFLRLTTFFNPLRINEINNCFYNSETESQIKALVKYQENQSDEIKRKSYWTNDMIIKTLEITKEEQQELQTIISKSEKKRRRSVKTYESSTKIIKLKKDLQKYFIQNLVLDLKNKYICEILKISNQTLKNYRKSNIDIDMINIELHLFYGKTESKIKDIQEFKQTELLDFINTLAA